MKRFFVLPLLLIAFALVACGPDWSVGPDDGGSGSGGGGGGFSKTYEDGRTGGQVYTEQGRIEQSKKSNGERQKYEKEAAMCKTLAKNGHTVVHLADKKRSDGSYDILLDGHKADLKSTKAPEYDQRQKKELPHYLRRLRSPG